MTRYWYKGEEKEVTDEIANAAMDAFEESFLEDTDQASWKNAREEGFDAALNFSTEFYNINLEQFFEEGRK